MRISIAAALAVSLAMPALAQDGLTLYQTFNGTTTFLIDGSGTVVHSWLGTTPPALSQYLLPDGDMLRTRNITGGGGGVGGGIERMSYGGLAEWQFTFLTPTLTPHHDIEVLPNGNVLMIVWEEVGRRGRRDRLKGAIPATVQAPSFDSRRDLRDRCRSGRRPGAVVWEWHAMGSPRAGLRPEPAELRRRRGPSRADRHQLRPATTTGSTSNGIDYNPALDQIALSVLNFSRDLDHRPQHDDRPRRPSHSGGKFGQGRRPAVPLRQRGRCTTAATLGGTGLLHFTHDVQWIEPGRPGAGNLIVFNNGNSRPSGTWSSADEWIPPVDTQGNYPIQPGVAFRPTGLHWTYSSPGSFHTAIMGGVERLASGNTLITESTSGRIFEVDPAGAITWTFLYSGGGLPWIFKARRYEDCDDNKVFDGHEIASGTGADLNQNGVLDVCETPTNYCVAQPNSTGLPSSMDWAGSTSLAANDLDLIAVRLPPSVAGLFLFSPNQGAFPFGHGTLCLSSPFLRQPAVSTSATGVATFDFDNQSLPAAAPPLVPGTTLNFTFWHRDPAAGLPGFNCSDGLSVLFVN